MYRPHWEVGHIAVRVSRRRKLVLSAVVAVGVLVAFLLGFVGLVGVSVLAALLALVVLTPAEERWSARFPANFKRGFDDKGGPIEFEGIVTARGSYGHRGTMDRRVEVLRVLRYHNRRVRPWIG